MGFLQDTDFILPPPIQTMQDLMTHLIWTAWDIALHSNMEYHKEIHLQHSPKHGFSYQSPIKER